MQQAILVLNLGSSSLKFAVYAIEHQQLNTTAIIKGQIAPLSNQAQFTFSAINSSPIKEKIKLQKLDKNIYAAAIRYLINWLIKYLTGYKIIAAGHRIVHGGNLFTKPIIVNPEVFEKLNLFSSLAPLHQPYNLAGIHWLTQQLPHVIQVACFDTSFHTTQPLIAQTYTLPNFITKQLIKSYGFHGLSYEYIAQVLSNYIEPNQAEGKIIVAHLGHGASLCALHQRKSIATTMGFTALEGLPMGTRCGSIDPGVILYLLEEQKMTVAEVNHLLYEKSGLLGVSEISGDIRELFENFSDPRAQFAIDLFIYHIVQKIGALTAILEGLDGLVFTGGIGEHCFTIREKVCKKLEWLGIQIAEEKNLANNNIISTSKSHIPVLVIPTNEELMIAKHTKCLIISDQEGFPLSK